MSLKDELESRPSQDDYEEKVKQCDKLLAELTTQQNRMSYNEQIMEQLRNEVSEQQSKQRPLSQLSECGSQTDLDDTEDDVSVIDVVESTKKELLNTPTNDLDDETDKASASTEMPQNSSSPITAIEDDDDELNNHPKVLYEDELILFKEKYKSLSDENIKLQREISELRATFGHFHGNWLHNAALKYLVPIIIVFIAYFFVFMR